jgi:hypothetical protein
MPIVIMRWKAKLRPASVPHSLIELLRNEAGMDATEIVSASNDLLNGKDVEAYFDYGENAATKALSEKLKASGLETTIRSDAEIDRSVRLDRIRSWLVPGIFAAIVLVGAIVEEPWYGIIALVFVGRRYNRIPGYSDVESKDMRAFSAWLPILLIKDLKHALHPQCQ